MYMYVLKYFARYYSFGVYTVESKRIAEMVIPQNFSHDLAFLFYTVSCENITLTEALHATVSTNGTVSAARYTCNLNYTLNGAALVLCQASGLWETNTPTCGKYLWTICYTPCLHCLKRQHTNTEYEP